MLPRFRPLFLVLALLTSGSLSHAASPNGTRQLLLTPGAASVTLNGRPAALRGPPQVVRGQVLVPLVEVLTLLGLPAVPVNEVPVEESGARTLGGQTYVDVRWLAASTGVGADISKDFSRVTLTAQAAPAFDPAAPQARFAPEKKVYAPGEPVGLVEYSFDPAGGAISKRVWTGRQDAYFSPGEYAVSLQVSNAQGKTSAPYTRVIQVRGPSVATPLEYALRYTPLGATFTDALVPNYASLPASVSVQTGFPLLFSDSPEKPSSPGVLYRDGVAGRARLLAYHVNGLAVNARLYILARNPDTRPVTLRTLGQGETAPSRVEGTLGQVALLDYFTSEPGAPLSVPAGQSAALYASPPLPPGSGVSVMQDIETSGRLELTFVLVQDGSPLSPEAMAALPPLALDGLHQRGTFPGANQQLRVTLGRLPARLDIGDNERDKALVGVDALTGTPMRLAGNYGVMYDVDVSGAAGTLLAISPRGGPYRGALQVGDGARSSLMRVPASGVLSSPEQPLALWRAGTDRLTLRFIPANGSNLPVFLVFYPLPPTR